MTVATLGQRSTLSSHHVRYDDGRFALDGHGPISAASTRADDQHGHLERASGGLCEWAAAHDSIPCGA